MARRKTGMTVAGVLSGTAMIVAVVVGVVNSGVYATFAEGMHLPVITNVSQLFPGADSQHKNGLGLNLPKPTAPDKGSSQSDGNGGSASDGVSAEGKLPAGASSPMSVGEALSAAKAMPTDTPHVKGYDRAGEFGGWANSDRLCGSGSTRDMILKRDMTGVDMDSQCRVLSGTLNDPYTGKSIEFRRDVYQKVSGKTRKVSGDSTAVQIDHVVALNDAWASGLWKESRKADRVTYANDPEVLLASQGAANNTKSMGVNLYGKGAPKQLHWSAGTPSVWLPDNWSYRCEYMAKRVYIKHKYGLSMSSWEKSETVSYLSQCAAP